MKHLTKVNDQLYRYHEPIEFDGMDLSIKFNVQYNGESWYTNYMDVGGDSPTEVVEQVFELMREESISIMESLKEKN